MKANVGHHRDMFYIVARTFMVLIFLILSNLIWSKILVRIRQSMSMYMHAVYIYIHMHLKRFSDLEFLLVVHLQLFLDIRIFQGLIVDIETMNIVIFHNLDKLKTNIPFHYCFQLYREICLVVTRLQLIVWKSPL